MPGDQRWMLKLNPYQNLVLIGKQYCLTQLSPLHPRAWPSLPWQRVHVDFTEPFRGRRFLILVDAHSKWPEVLSMSTTTAAATI